MKPIRVPIIGDDKVSHVLKGINKNLKSFSVDAMAVGTKLTAAISLPVLAFAGMGVKMSNDLNAALAKASMNMDGTTAEITSRLESYKPAIRSIAVEMGKSTDKIAESLGRIFVDFGETNESLEILKITEMAAKGAAVEHADALNLVAGVCTAFNQNTAEAVRRVTDLTFATAKLGGDTFKEVSDAIPQLSLLSNNLSISQEEMFATFASGGNVLENTNDRMAAIHGVLSSLQKPTNTMSQLFEHLGVKSGTAMVKKYGFFKALSLIVSKAKEADVPISKLIKGAESQAFAQQFTTKCTEDFAAALNTLIGTSGNTDEAFKKQTEGIDKLGHKFNQAKVQLQQFAERLGDFLSPGILKVVGFGEKLIGMLDKMPRPVKIAMVAIAGMAAVMGPIIVGIAMVAATIAAISSPVGLVVTIIVGACVALAAIVGIVILKWKPIKSFFHGLFDFLGKLWHSRIAAIVLYANPITLIPALIIRNFGGIKKFFVGLFDSLKDIFGKFADWIGGWAEKINKLPFIQTLKDILGSAGDIDEVGADAGGNAVRATGKYLLGSSENNAFYADKIAASARDVRKTEITKKESRVDFYFHDAPKGTHVKQGGAGFLQSDLGLIYGGVQ